MHNIDRSRSTRITGETGKRTHWIDALRGLCIVLVISFHAYAVAAADAGLIFEAAEIVNQAFSPFRMPIMMFLSGLFVTRSLAKGVRPYLSGKLRTLAYPYLIWSAIMLLLIFVASLTVDHPFSVGMISSVFYKPIEHTWFLAFLFLYFLLALALRAVNPLVVAGVFFALSLVQVDEATEGFWYFATFFMLGVSATRYEKTWIALTRNIGASAAFAVASLSVFTLLAFFEPASNHPLAITPLVIASIAGVSGVMMRVGESAVLRPMRYVGRNSIVFYLVHWPVVVVLSQIFTVILGTRIVVLFSVVAVLTMVITWVIALAVARLPFLRYLFVLPRRRPHVSWSKSALWFTRPSTKFTRPTPLREGPDKP